MAIFLLFTNSQLVHHQVQQCVCFQNNPCPHPIIFMRDCEVSHVRALLQFMYVGQVNIAQAQLSSFLRTADALQIRGLTDCSQHNDKVRNTFQNNCTINFYVT
jgi:hypothetical protein